jgi:hypothetical protein
MPDRDDELDLPRSLRDALQAMHRTPEVPAGLDERILFAAREAFDRRLRTRMILRRTAAAGGAVAAAVAIFFGVHALRPEPAAPVAMDATPAARDGDVDRNGRVDIADALLLARKVDAGLAPDQRWEDLDRDGRLTRADVEQVARTAVRLPDAAAGGTLQ